MLQSVFKELYDQGVLIFLDTNTYVTNNTDAGIENFTDRAKFMSMYDEPVEHGWIFCRASLLDDVLKTLKEDTCYMVEFGFNSDTETKAIAVGKRLYDALIKFDYVTSWNENVLETRSLSTVVTVDNLPRTVRDMVEVDDDYENDQC